MRNTPRKHYKDTTLIYWAFSPSKLFSLFHWSSIIVRFKLISHLLKQIVMPSSAKCFCSFQNVYHNFHKILKSPLVPSLYCHSTNMCRASHLQNPQHKTDFLNSLVGYRMRCIVEQMINTTNTQPAVAANIPVHTILLLRHNTKYSLFYHLYWNEHEFHMLTCPIMVLWWSHTLMH